MPTGSLTTAHRLLAQAVDELSAVAVSGADDELVSLLTVCEGAARRLDRVTVDAVAALERRGTFAERGYKSTAGALRDLLGWERFEARRRVTAAEQVDGPGRAGRLRAACATAPHRGRLRARGGEPATRRCRGARIGDIGGGAAHPRAVGRGRGADRGEDRRLHPVRAGRVGHRIGRGAGPGRRRAGRPATATGQRAVPDPHRHRRRGRSRAGSTTPPCSTPSPP